jgi:hypothetical protein
MDLYFLRSTENKRLFIHPVGNDVFQPVYGLKQGAVGAACFTLEMADNFIAAAEGVVLEKLSVTKYAKLDPKPN